MRRTAVFLNLSVDTAVQTASDGVYFNHGQCCCAGTRVFVESKIYDNFVAKAKEQAESRRLGNPFDPQTQQGPQIDQDQLNTILKYINIGKKEGAQLVSGKHLQLFKDLTVSRWSSIRR